MFRTLDACLRWTFDSASVPIDEISSIGQWMETARNKRVVMPHDERLDKLPRGFERLAQSGMILAELSKLGDGPVNDALLALYARGVDRRNARFRLTRYVLSRMNTVIRKPRLVMALVERHYGSRARLVPIAIKFKVHPKTALNHSHRIAELLDALTMTAMREADELLEDAGILLVSGTGQGG